jgi:opacity protein-like surface antigen
MSVRKPVLALLGLLLFAPDLSGQSQSYVPPGLHVGMDFIVGDPMGEFSEFVGAGYGADFRGRIALDPAGVLSLRGDFGFLVYGYESKRVCFEGVGCRIQAELQTTNLIGFGGIGPELALPLPGARPYVNAQMGFSYFSTSSSLQDDWGGEPGFVTQNFGEGTVSWGLGGGIEVNLSKGRTPIDLNLGVRYHQNGRVKYLTEGDIVDNPDGSITLYPILSEANLMSYHFGVSIGIPRGGQEASRYGQNR